MLIKKCRQSGKEYDLSAVFCNRDGARLEDFDRDDDPYLGKIILGCRILSRLGKGGMGAVYLAEHVELELKRAIKVIHRELAPDASFIERFRVEARAASRIEHPNVIKVYDFGKTDDDAFAMVMEFLEGESLADILKREKRLAPERAVSVAVEIARGLDVAHQLDIVHRDLKPDNVMILKNDRIKVVDFGIAKVAGGGNLTGTGKFIGTPHYASPEQASGQKNVIDARSDIFTLGLMLYEMLSGRLPYDCGGKEWFGILLDRVNGSPLPLTRSLPEEVVLPDALLIAVMRALAREPKDRQVSATEFADEIEAAMCPVAVIPPSAMIITTPTLIVPATLPKTFINSIGMEFVFVPAGIFPMGSHRYSIYGNEAPIHEVRIGNPFYFGKYQVTQGEWKKVMTPNLWKAILGGTNPSHFKGNDLLPVELVSWNDCQDFLKMLNEMDKDVVYRLPSEAEWEYACRARTTGDYAGNLDELGWYDKNSSGKTQPVGLQKANDFGLYDMHGNVWEWCQDRWHGNYTEAPPDGSAWETGEDERRVFRGGAWNCSFEFCRSAHRHGVIPTDAFKFIGFRVVAVLN